MKKLLVICGPTATGKTSLALHLAKVFDGELVSADSRQVYRGLDIGTGKDKGEMGDIPLWGIDLVDPKDEFHVQEYINIVQKVIENIWNKNKLPILVGGTGFYIKALIDGIPTIEIPKNDDLRSRMMKENGENLLEMLSKIDPVKAASFNVSDRQNPRRLMRAIEVAIWKLDNKGEEKEKPIFDDLSVLMIGLTASKEHLRSNISRRTDKMFKDGILDEIKGLLGGGLTWDLQSMNTIGYLEWKDYFDGAKSKDEVLDKWKSDEASYAKRQMTWFKKDKRINWFNIKNRDYKKEVERLVKKWYI
jgi:tRNA dimethylallyltransferase